MLRVSFRMAASGAVTPRFRAAAMTTSVGRDGSGVRMARMVAERDGGGMGTDRVFRGWARATGRGPGDSPSPS